MNTTLIIELPPKKLVIELCPQKECLRIAQIDFLNPDTEQQILGLGTHHPYPLICPRTHLGS